MYIHVYFRRPPSQTTPKNPGPKSFWRKEKSHIILNWKSLRSWDQVARMLWLCFPRNNALVHQQQPATIYWLPSIAPIIEVKTPSSHWNLTELRRKARSGVEKRYGRKRPRPGDSEASPAPDAPGKSSPMENQPQENQKEKAEFHDVPIQTRTASVVTQIYVEGDYFHLLCLPVTSN